MRSKNFVKKHKTKWASAIGTQNRYLLVLIINIGEPDRDVDDIYQWRWFEENEQSLENVDQAHLVLASGKLELQKRTWENNFFCPLFVRENRGLGQIFLFETCQQKCRWPKMFVIGTPLWRRCIAFHSTINQSNPRLPFLLAVMLSHCVKIQSSGSTVV